jgi:hypothetical protein
LKKLNKINNLAVLAEHPRNVLVADDYSVSRWAVETEILDLVVETDVVRDPTAILHPREGDFTLHWDVPEIGCFDFFAFKIPHIHAPDSALQ